MDWIIASGASSLGILVGALVGWFVIEADRWDHKALGSSVAILTGGGVAAMLGMLSSSIPREVWFYPVGALFGFVIVSLIDFYFYDYDGNKRKHRSSRISRRPKTESEKS